MSDIPEGSGGQWIPITQAAVLLGLSDRTLRRQRTTGRLRTRKVDGHIEVWVSSTSMSANSHAAADVSGFMADIAMPAADAGSSVADMSATAIAELARALEREQERSQAAEHRAENNAASAAMWQERARNLEEETKHLRTQLALPPTQPEPLPWTDPMEELRAKVEELTRQLQAQPDPEPRSWWQRWQRWRRM